MRSFQPWTSVQADWVRRVHSPMNILILTNGDPPTGDFLRRLSDRHNVLIAADGAAHTAATLGVTPNIVCGDFDSVRMDDARAAFPHAEFITTPDQDMADLEKAIQVARDRGATAITITGAAGGRIDHTLANFTLLLRYGPEFPISIVDAGSEVRALAGTDKSPGEWTVTTQPGDTISLISFDGHARATILGVRWPLHDHRLPVGTFSVSNRATSDHVSIQVRGGAVVACHLF
jgi:thiamine pyrophosphokinase